MGPHYTLHPDFKSSPIGAFKRHRSNKVRPIHDLSWPPEFSTNSGIDTTQYSVSYTTVDNIVRFGLMYDEPWASKITCLARLGLRIDNYWDSHGRGLIITQNFLVMLVYPLVCLPLVAFLIR